MNISEIKKHMELFSRITDIDCFLIDETGGTILRIGEEKPYCSQFRGLTGEACPCMTSHLYAAKQSESLGEAYVFFCPAGLVHFTSAIVVGDAFLGAIVAGPLQMNLPDPYIVNDILKIYSLPITAKGHLETFYRMIPIVEPEKVRYLSDLLTMMTRDFMSEERDNLKKKKAFYDEQRLISESVHEIKAMEVQEAEPGYPMQLEADLCDRIKRKDVDGAKAILNDLLGYIFFKHGLDETRVTGMILELVVVMSRAAVEGGARYEEIFDQNLNYYLNAFKTDSVESMYVWVVELLERFTNLIFPMSSEKVESVNIIKKAIAYINRNFATNLTLDEVSDYVNLSPTYFSRFFSKETNMKFVEYLNMVRVEESKKYLMDLKYGISDIAVMMGFSDQSYFTKVFKKYENMSPGKFRKMHN